MNTAYPLIPVSLIIVLAFFTSRLFAKWEIYSLKIHRKFWNVLLLITFLVSGLLGIFSIVKINYKLDVSFYDQLLKWHVAFGIGMVFISFFHLSWHLKYYFKREKSKPANRQKKAISVVEISGLKRIQHLLFILGGVAIINQIVFIREFIAVLSGNELILGVVMANWLLLTGAGAFLGKRGIPARFKLNRGVEMLFAVTLFPVVITGLLYWLKSRLYPPGTIIDLGASFTGTFLLLFPVCVLSGYLFTTFAAILSDTNNKNTIGQAYAFESLGSLFGGLLFSVILGRFLNSFQVFGLLFFVTALTGALFTISKNKARGTIYILSGMIVLAMILIFDPDTHFKQTIFPNQEIVLNKSTRYGNLVVTEQAGQLNFYENNDLLFYTNNLMVNEESVHFAMVQHKNPKSVLLISGGIAGMIDEIEKYEVEKITYLETNPEIFDKLYNFGRTFYDSDITEIVRSDIRTYLRKTNDRYDVILINISSPITLGYNRFYTEEFFKTVKKHCNSETVVSVTLTSTANYAEQNALEVNSSLWNTLICYFNNQLLLQGELNYFLASDQSLTTDITAEIEKKKIKTEYVNQYYLDDELLKLRSQTIRGQLIDTTPVNRDYNPVMFEKQIGYWLSHFNISYYIIIIISGLFFVLLSFKFDPVTIGLYTGGFTASSMEIAMLLAYQIYFGSIYLSTAFFFTAFMAGLALGSALQIKPGITIIKKYYSLQFLLASFTVLLPVFIYLAGLISGWWISAQFLFFILITGLAFAIGYEFNLATRLQTAGYSRTAGISYSSDLAGSAFGAFLTAVFLLPVLGLTVTCILVAVLNVISGSTAFIFRKSYMV